MSSTDIQKSAGTEVTMVIPSIDELGKLKELSPSFKLDLHYKTAEHWAKIKDKPIRCIYMGLKDLPNDNGENVVCGKFISTSEMFIAGQMVLIEAVRNLDPNTPIQITYKGNRRNKSTEGSTMLFEVELLS